jgi:UDP-N-acetylmuramate-alanine ligase
LAEFASAFSDADEVGILPIYASARETVQVIDTAEVVTAMRTYHKHVRSYSSLELFFQGYSQETNRDDVVLFLGAGDIGRNARTYLSSSYV